MGGEEAPVGPGLSHLGTPTAQQLHPRADPHPVAPGPFQAQRQPVCRRRGFVVEEEWRTLEVGGQEIDPPVVVEVAGGQSPADDPLTEVRADLVADLLEAPVPYVQEELRRLRIRDVRVYLLDQVPYVAIDHGQIV
ncbi:MAG: hypothetical protein K0Q72_2918 [Armatimonadetes bacterium]|nr:hypothetical protein [Armatimonadota bacterium]